MAEVTKRAKKGKKGRKYGRNSVRCKRYRAENRRAKNKARRLRRVLKRNPTDTDAKAALKQWEDLT